MKNENVVAKNPNVPDNYLETVDWKDIENISNSSNNPVVQNNILNDDQSKQSVLDQEKLLNSYDVDLNVVNSTSNSLEKKITESSAWNL